MERAGSVNAYSCGQHVTLTILLNDGVTPLFAPCPACQRPAQSAQYNFQWKGGGVMLAAHCWFRPRLLNDAMKQNESFMKHAFAGGLVFDKFRTGLQNLAVYDKVRWDDKPLVLRSKLKELWSLKDEEMPSAILTPDIGDSDERGIR